jgi:hypothetical protein
MPPLEIVEIIRPAEQGRTTPFLCRADDEMLYYVKGKNAGKRNQFCEWVAAHLAKSFGLPVPPFRLVTVSEELLFESPESHQLLGAGIAFASLARAGTQWFECSFVSEVPHNLRCEVLAFDWWIHNMDRLDDNTNLLWDAGSKQLVVIDHDVAFEDAFWPTVFLENHVFRQEWATLLTDATRRTEYMKRMGDALSIWQDACDSAPMSWRTRNFGDASETIFDCPSALTILRRCATEELWTR